MPVAIAYEILPLPTMPPSPPSPPPPVAAKTSFAPHEQQPVKCTPPKRKLCDSPECTSSAKRFLRGFDIAADGTRIKRMGDALCERSVIGVFVKCKLHIEDAIPMPPGRPGGYLVARTRQLKTVERKIGVAIAWCRGD